MAWRRWLPPVSLVLIALGLYARTIGGEFLRWDDRQNILLNPFIEHALWSQTWTRSYYNMYIPVTYSVWTILWHIAREPWIFHLTNVCLHAANAVLVYAVGRRIFPRDWRAAWVAAAFFAVHPLQVETVAWISTGRDLLSAFFGLLAAYLVLAKDSWRWWVAATILFCLGLLSKPSLAVLPVGLIAVSWATARLNLGRALTLKLWLIPALAAVITTKIIQQLDADLRLVPLGLFDRVLVAGDTLGFYLRRIAWPYPLSSDYGRSPRIALENFAWAPGCLIAAAVVLAIFVGRRRLARPEWAGVFWAILFISPVLGLIPFQAQGQSTVSDRYAYLPLIGVGLAFGSIGGRYLRVAIPTLAALATWTALRAGVWLNNQTFFLDMLATNPSSFVAHSSLGVEYILRQQYDKADYFLNEAIKLKPTDSIPRTNLAQLYLLQRRPDRVTNEIAPLLNDRNFLHQNQTETRALASAYRLTARAYWMQGQYTSANELFCRWFRLDWENEDGKAEVTRFMRDAAEKKAEIPNCEFVPKF